MTGLPQKKKRSHPLLPYGDTKFEAVGLLSFGITPLFQMFIPPEKSGWICKPDGTYEIEWETAEVQAKIQSTIDFLLKGCNCKKAAKTTCADVSRREAFVVLDVCVKGALTYLQLVMMIWMMAALAVTVMHQMDTQVMTC